MRKNKKTIAVIVVFIATAGLLVWNPFTSNNAPGISADNEDKITVYKDPNCGCCVQWISYLKKQGFETEVVNTTDMESVKKEHGIPRNIESCHTAIIEDYFIEGHMPIEVVNKLLEEKPSIDGVALPGMPSGSPGMPGIQRGPFEIYSLIKGQVSEFMIID